MFVIHDHSVQIVTFKKTSNQEQGNSHHSACHQAQRFSSKFIRQESARHCAD